MEPKISLSVGEDICWGLSSLSSEPLIDHFTVVCSVTWPLNESESGVDLALLETSLLFYVNDVVLMLIRRNLHKKSSDVSIKAKSTPTLLSFKGQKTKHTTVKWSIVCIPTKLTRRARGHFVTFIETCVLLLVKARLSAKFL